MTGEPAASGPGAAAIERRYSTRDMLRVALFSALVTAIAVSFVGLPSVPPPALGPAPSPVADGSAVPRSQPGADPRIQLELSPQEKGDLAKLFYYLNTWYTTDWLGIPALKTTYDIWMMQHIITELRPDFIIETGTYKGGSALFFASVLDGLDLPDSRIITIDIEDMTEAVRERPLWQRRVDFILSSSTDPDTVAAIAERVRGKTVLVTLDSLHTRDHVLQELQMYGPLVSPGSYIIAEDTALDGVPTDPSFSPGPAAAVADFLASDAGAGFVSDERREAFVLTFNPGGWLRRVE